MSKRQSTRSKSRPRRSTTSSSYRNDEEKEEAINSYEDSEESLPGSRPTRKSSRSTSSRSSPHQNDENNDANFQSYRRNTTSSSQQQQTQKPRPSRPSTQSSSHQRGRTKKQQQQEEEQEEEQQYQQKDNGNDKQDDFPKRRSTQASKQQEQQQQFKSRASKKKHDDEGNDSDENHTQQDDFDRYDRTDSHLHQHYNDDNDDSSPSKDDEHLKRDKNPTATTAIFEVDTAISLNVFVELYQWVKYAADQQDYNINLPMVQPLPYEFLPNYQKHYSERTVRRRKEGTYHHPLYEDIIDALWQFPLGCHYTALIPRIQYAQKERLKQFPKRGVKLASAKQLKESVRRKVNSNDTLRYEIFRLQDEPTPISWIILRTFITSDNIINIIRNLLFEEEHKVLETIDFNKLISRFWLDIMNRQYGLWRVYGVQYMQSHPVHQLIGQTHQAQLEQSRQLPDIDTTRASLILYTPYPKRKKSHPLMALKNPFVHFRIPHDFTAVVLETLRTKQIPPDWWLTSTDVDHVIMDWYEQEIPQLNRMFGKSNNNNTSSTSSKSTGTALQRHPMFHGVRHDTSFNFKPLDPASTLLDRFRRHGASHLDRHAKYLTIEDHHSHNHHYHSQHQLYDEHQGNQHDTSLHRSASSSSPPSRQNTRRNQSKRIGTSIVQEQGKNNNDNDEEAPQEPNYDDHQTIYEKEQWHTLRTPRNTSFESSPASSSTPLNKQSRIGLTQPKTNVFDLPSHAMDENDAFRQNYPREPKKTCSTPRQDYGVGMNSESKPPYSRRTSSFTSHLKLPPSISSSSPPLPNPHAFSNTYDTYLCNDQKQSSSERTSNLRKDKHTPMMQTNDNDDDDDDNNDGMDMPSRDQVPHRPSQRTGYFINPRTNTPFGYPNYIEQATDDQFDPYFDNYQGPYTSTSNSKHSAHDYSFQRHTSHQPSASKSFQQPPSQQPPLPSQQPTPPSNNDDETLRNTWFDLFASSNTLMNPLLSGDIIMDIPEFIFNMNDNQWRTLTHSCYKVMLDHLNQMALDEQLLDPDDRFCELPGYTIDELEQDLRAMHARAGLLRFDWVHNAIPIFIEEKLKAMKQSTNLPPTSSLPMSNITRPSLRRTTSRVGKVADDVIWEMVRDRFAQTAADLDKMNESIPSSDVWLSRLGFVVSPEKSETLRSFTSRQQKKRHGTQPLTPDQLKQNYPSVKRRETTSRMDRMNPFDTNVNTTTTASSFMRAPARGSPTTHSIIHAPNRLTRQVGKESHGSRYRRMNSDRRTGYTCEDQQFKLIRKASFPDKIKTD